LKGKKRFISRDMEKKKDGEKEVKW